jgi:hypothetical protein
VGVFDSYAFRRSYRPEGAVSTFVHNREVGDAVEFKHVAENVKVPYPFDATRVNMIAVGAGIAPMVQALDRILHTPGDTRRVVVLYGNRSVEDILLRETLDAWAVTHADRLKVVYAVGSRWANVHVGMKTRVKRLLDDGRRARGAAGARGLPGPADVAEPGARGRLGRPRVHREARVRAVAGNADLRLRAAVGLRLALRPARRPGAERCAAGPRLRGRGRR